MHAHLGLSLLAGRDNAVLLLVLITTRNIDGQVALCTPRSLIWGIQRH